MSINLLSILERLKRENLYGPSNYHKKGADGNDPWRLISNEHQDLDSRDPRLFSLIRWFELFMEYFIDSKNQVADDILFFVRQYVPNHKSSSGSINELDPVLVKRRIPGQTPALTDVIDWKQSFFLNLISQLPCTLTVSICTKLSDPKEVIDHTSPTVKKNGMICKSRITKKVFAAPYKSRMDIKDAMMNECSYPLVYYTINDFELESLHMSISNSEYLCAELSVTIPDTQDLQAYTKATELVAQISPEENPEPFPLPPNHSKIVLFQGAVSFNALSAVYQQKGVAAQNQLKGGWGRQSDTIAPRVEYVLMRGPHGKGQCQGFYLLTSRNSRTAGDSC
jgi:hypothetical protein